MNTTGEPIVLAECTLLASRLFLAMVELVFDFINDFHHTPSWEGYIYLIRKRIVYMIEAMQARKNCVLYLPGYIRKIRETGNILLSEVRDIYTRLVQIMFPCAQACTTGSFIVMDSVIYLAFLCEIQGDHLLIMLQSDKELQELRQGRATCREMLSHAIKRTRRVHFMWAHNGLEYTVLHDDAESRKRKFSTCEDESASFPLRKKGNVKRARFA
jgi:hypothetical protein